MLIPNCLFRVGGAAIVLSNKPQDARRAKYRLVRSGFWGEVERGKMRDRKKKREETKGKKNSLETGKNKTKF